MLMGIISYMDAVMFSFFMTTFVMRVALRLKQRGCAAAIPSSSFVGTSTNFADSCLDILLW